jgi:hypothetical protein
MSFVDILGLVGVGAALGAAAVQYRLRVPGWWWFLVSAALAALVVWL